VSDSFSFDGGPNIKITRVVEGFGPAAPGQTTRVMNVYFTVNKTPEQHVEVPLEPGWVERAKSEVIQHAADIIDLLSTQFTPS